MEREMKKKIIERFAVHPKDTGSAQVQIAILTDRINSLSEHLKTHNKDGHSRRGLLGLVEDRRKHLQYLKMHNTEIYNELLEKLKLRK
ncbi:MAG: 30S ribosomal protein S15 [Candidatus Gracilibacteria bacterium]|jgi:small subunit ribosomal protein S15